jgi:hypothetical protein
MAKKYPVVYVSGSPQEIASSDRIHNSGNVVRAGSAPGSPVDGDLWYDTGNSSLKIYDGSSWAEVTSSASAPILESAKVIVTANLSVTSGSNGLSIGDVTINSGCTVTVPNNSEWVLYPF